MAAKGAGATADRGDHVHHFHHREEVVATTISRRVNHYRSALRTSSGLHPYHYWFAPVPLLVCTRTTIGLHYEQVVVCIPPYHNYSQQAP